MWAGGEPGPGADVAGVGQVPVQMWRGWAKSRCSFRKGRAQSRRDVVPEVLPSEGLPPILMASGTIGSQYLNRFSGNGKRSEIERERGGWGDARRGGGGG